MENAELFLKKQSVTGIQKDVTDTEINELLTMINKKFDLNVMDIIKKIIKKEVDGFSLNKNNPYTHLYIGNGGENISIEIVTLENETKLKIPKSSIP